LANRSAALAARWRAEARIAARQKVFTVNTF
jgi:hypothetical protein